GGNPGSPPGTCSRAWPGRPSTPPKGETRGARKPGAPGVRFFQSRSWAWFRRIVHDDRHQRDLQTENGPGWRINRANGPGEVSRTYYLGTRVPHVGRLWRAVPRDLLSCRGNTRHFVGPHPCFPISASASRWVI